MNPIQPLSGGAGDGTPIKISTTTPEESVVLHTVPDGEVHEITMFSNNEDAGSQRLIVEWGARGVDYRSTKPVPALSGDKLIIAARRLVGPAVVYGYALDDANVLFVTGGANAFAWVAP